MDGTLSATAALPALALPRSSITRPRRVMILLVGIVVLSLADLVITLTHLQSTGMAEANPIARAVIGSTGSPLSLTCFKALSVLTCVMLLYRVRRTTQGEIAAWCAMLILAGMSVLWFLYAAQHESPSDLQFAQSQIDSHLWVRFE